MITDLRQDYTQHFAAIQAYQPVRMTTDMMLALGYTAHARGPATTSELEAIHSAVTELVRDPKVADGPPWNWIARRVRTRPAGWVHAQIRAIIARDRRAADVLAPHYVPLPDEEEEAELDAPMLLATDAGFAGGSRMP